MSNGHAIHTRAARVIELDGSSEPLIVRIAGWEYEFRITGPSDAAYQVIERTPEGDPEVLTEGSEW